MIWHAWATSVLMNGEGSYFGCYHILLYYL